MEKNKAVIVENIKYSYLSANKTNQAERVFKEVLKGLSFVIERGEIVSIIGPNGAGKSTLLLNLAGLLDFKYRRGAVKIFETELNSKSVYDIREKIGFVFQDPNDQLFSTTVFDDVAFGLINLLNKKKDPRAKDTEYIREKVMESLETVNLAGSENEVPHFLSFGEKKLAALATVLSYDPEIFILDEPSSNLDPKNRDAFMSLIKHLGKTVIIATHDIDMAYELSTRTIIINNGCKAYDGPADKILSDRCFLEKNDLRLPLVLKNHC